VIDSFVHTSISIFLYRDYEANYGQKPRKQIIGHWVFFCSNSYLSIFINLYLYINIYCLLSKPLSNK